MRICIPLLKPCMLGNDVRRLRVMQHELTVAIQKRKWTWKPESLQTLGIIDNEEPVSFKADGKWYLPEKVTQKPPRRPAYYTGEV